MLGRGAECSVLFLLQHNLIIGSVMDELGVDPQFREWDDGVSLSRLPQGMKHQVPDVVCSMHPSEMSP